MESQLQERRRSAATSAPEGLGCPETADGPLRIRPGSLRDILDDEFSRNHRFEGLSAFLSDLRGFLRGVMEREEEVVGATGLFQSPHRQTPA